MDFVVLDQIIIIPLEAYPGGIVCLDMHAVRHPVKIHAGTTRDLKKGILSDYCRYDGCGQIQHQLLIDIAT